ncbi:MAG: DUF1573 domain-containing protein [Candidatus Auribacterota bacterium]|jgi:hypothetical protein|nr:DUF1573 domain-containing protein [Candidatus Auribacterota bacterium]
MKKISRMAKFFITVCFLFLLNPADGAQNDYNASDAKGAVQSDQTQPAPKVMFPEPVWDFGKIKQGEKVSHTYRVINSGTADLVIQQIRPSCGCTAVIPTKNVLAPSETGYLETTFDSAGRDGQQLKKIYVITNDPVQGTFELDIKGSIYIPPGPRIAYHPNAWDFGLQEIDATPSTEIVIKNEGIGDLELTQIQISHLCSATLTPEGAIAPGKEAVLKVSLLPLKNPGVVETYVNIRTNDTTKPNIPVRILGYVKGNLPPAVLLTPTEWDFGIVYKDAFEPPETVFYVRNAGGEDLIFERIKVPYGFTSDIETPVTIGPGKEEKFVFKLINPFQTGTVQQYLFLYTNDPVHSVRRVNIYGYIAENKSE